MSTGRGYAPCVKKDTSVNIRLTSELRAELQRLAEEDGRKLSAYIERLLQLHVRAAREAPEGVEPAKPDLRHQLHRQGLMEAGPLTPLRKKKRD